MRILLFTGKGGVGKSTVAAGTAALAAAGGRRTLVLSTDAAHSLADAYAVTGRRRGSGAPVEVADRLWLRQVDAQARLERSWAQVQDYLRGLLERADIDPVAAEELTVLPGAEEVLALLELREQVRSGRWDTVVVDCAPTAETLRLLALPEALGWYLDRVTPAERRVVRALRPLLAHTLGAPPPGEPVIAAAERLRAELADVRSLLAGPEASVRLVLTPEQVVLAEARRSWTHLSLYGYRVDGVVANRVFPAAGGDDWRAGWVMAQDDVLAEVERSFAGLPVWRAEYRPAEPIGVRALGRLATDLYAGDDPLAPPIGPAAYRVSRTPEGAVLALPLPLAVRADVDLARAGDELVVTVGSHRRVVTLPSSLARMRTAGAGVADGELRVRFADPAARERAEATSERGDHVEEAAG